jgi:arabinose-5-phosphate isomerase
MSIAKAKSRLDTAYPTPNDDDLAVAHRVLATERAGLDAMAGLLDESFAEAVGVMARAHSGGRVVVTGMGKSGHVARKIAATLASTGTPAIFVHPAEASHGDLGMVTRDDTVLAISNSGETAELGDIIAHAKRWAIPVVAITAERTSELARAADVILIIPDSAEACPLNLAPTTSTTVTMALGDALAVALLERVGFSREDFKARHPGGKLGSRLIKVEAIMHRGEALPLVDQDAPMADVLIIMTSKSFGCIGLLDPAGVLVGIVTDGDLRRNMAADLLSRPARTVMTTEPETITPEMLAEQAISIMNELSITSLFVVEDNRPVGILHIHDCLRVGVD